LQRPRRRLIDRTEDLGYFILDDGPIVRREDNDRESALGQILLVNEGGVTCSSPFFSELHPLCAAVMIS
jgi:hypothetical protein